MALRYVKTIAEARREAKRYRKLGYVGHLSLEKNVTGGYTVSSNMRFRKRRR